MTARKLAPLSQKAVDTPRAPTTSPAAAFPTMRLAIRFMLLRTLACRTCSRLDRSRMKAPAAGMSSALRVPRPNASM
jgi:hypothetical protein